MVEMAIVNKVYMDFRNICTNINAFLIPFFGAF